MIPASFPVRSKEAGRSQSDAERTAGARLFTDSTVGPVVLSGEGQMGNDAARVDLRDIDAWG